TIEGDKKLKTWSANPLRDELGRLLEVARPASSGTETYSYVIDVFPTFVVYAVRDKGITTEYRRSYTINKESAVVLGDDVEEVAVETKYTTKDGTVLNASSLSIPAMTGAETNTTAKPKVWSFNTIRTELDRLVSETLAAGLKDKDEYKPYASIIDVFPNPLFFIYTVFTGNGSESFYQSYSIDGDTITLGNDRIQISIETKYTMPDGVVLNTSSNAASVKQNVPVNDFRKEGDKNTQETEESRRRIEELRKHVLDLTTQLYEITGRDKKGNVLSQSDWQKVKKIQEVLDKAKAFVVKEMASVRGVAPVRHDELMKSTKDELLEMARALVALRAHYREQLQKVS
ncbi:MAG: hypothetical protein LBP87_06720, partial [Planctomycetaceae bacterium]|nr:hypothetical protein [Planctomycetaceae bacterium]